jgi:hypothetical protein
MQNTTLDSIKKLLQKEEHLANQKLFQEKRELDGIASQNGMFNSGLYLNDATILYSESFSSRYESLKRVISDVAIKVDPSSKIAIVGEVKDIAREWLVSQKQSLEVGLSSIYVMHSIGGASTDIDTHTYMESLDTEIDLILNVPEIVQKVFSEPSVKHFINPNRFEEIRKLESAEFDLSKLIRLLEELDSSYQQGNLLAVPILIRAVLDHVPPIFKKQSFAEVANSSAKSTKDQLLYLEDFVRKLADGNLHTKIRNAESLPNKTQVECLGPFDVLLAEVSRVLRTE